MPNPNYTNAVTLSNSPWIKGTGSSIACTTSSWPFRSYFM